MLPSIAVSPSLVILLNCKSSLLLLQSTNLRGCLDYVLSTILNLNSYFKQKNPPIHTVKISVLTKKTNK